MQETARHNPPSNAPDLSDFGVKIWQPTPKAIERMKVKGYFSFGANPYLAFERNSYNLSDDLGWVHGNHNFTFGGRIELSKINNGGPTKLRGCSPSIRTLAVAWQAFCSVLCRPSFRAQVRAPLCATRSPEFMRRIPGGSLGACPSTTACAMSVSCPGPSATGASRSSVRRLTSLEPLRPFTPAHPRACSFPVTREWRRRLPRHLHSF